MTADERAARLRGVQFDDLFGRIGSLLGEPPFRVGDVYTHDMRYMNGEPWLRRGVVTRKTLDGRDYLVLLYDGKSIDPNWDGPRRHFPWVKK